MAKLDVDKLVRIETAAESSFSSDGSRIVFCSNRSGVPQAYVVDARGEDHAEARALTDTGGVVYGARSQPEHDAVLYVTDEGGNEQYQLHLLELGTGRSRALASAPDVIHQPGAWCRDGVRLSFTSNRRDRRYSDVYVIDTRTGRERLVYQQDGMNSAGRFNDDASALIVSRPNLDAGAGDNGLWLVHLERDEVRCLTEHGGIARWMSAAFTRSGDVLALSDEGREFVGVQQIRADGSRREYVIELDWDVEQLALSRDGRRIALVVNEDGYSSLDVLEIDAEGRPGASVALPELPRGAISMLRWRADGEALTFTLVSDSLPSAVWVVELGGSAPRRVSRSRHDVLPEGAIPEALRVRYPSFDGREIPALFYLPAERPAAVPLPCLILVHGGPEAQARPGSLWRRAATLALLAEGRLAVLVPNVRGSTGYGKEYAHADDVEKRMDSVRDLIAATDWLAASGHVDPGRIAVSGASYGGFMTLAAITEAPERWAAAIDLFGIANFETFMERTGVWRRKHRAAEYGSDPAFLRSISPIHKVDRIRAPLLVVQGDQDVRVPPHESAQMVEALRSRGAVVDYLLFEQEGHGIQKLSNRLALERRTAEFLEEHLLQ